ncbi:MAG: folylpolyglutamate synthase/dihydrofolate synthase family protein [Planctomycetota bacterium]|nr:folylpolyglutamate synthase/dihydrofolate synthase family protein [Planctomycetota bacterium]
MHTNVAITTFAEAQAYLYRRFDFERTMVAQAAIPFKLDRMRNLAARLGNPQQTIPAVHIAGTKGKGSTAAMTASILTAAKHKTGLFTSPHLENLRQRFQIDGKWCSELEFVKLVNQLVPVVQAMDIEADLQPIQDLKPTFFELTTVLAFLWFQQQQVDIAVIEVGLGGRLDSTNICYSIVTAITNISLDHTSLLGNTVELIAAEKAGIIKSKVPLVHGCTAGPQIEIETRAQQADAHIIRATQDIQYSIAAQSAQGATLRDVSMKIGQRSKQWPLLEIGLPGQHQIDNALIVLGIAGCLMEQGFKIDDQAIVEGLANTDCPGRLEYIAGQPAILLDVAHNPDSITKLSEYLQQHFADQAWHLVFSCSQDKPATDMLNILIDKFESITLTQFHNNPRAVDCGALLEIAQQSAAHNSSNDTAVLQIDSDPVSAIADIEQRADSADLIVIAGSFYLIAECRKQLIEKSKSSTKQ